MSWADRALCAQFPPGADDYEKEQQRAIFHPPTNALGKYRERDVLAAEAFCLGCPVRNECLEFGLTDPCGIYAGTTPDERKVLRQGRWRAERLARAARDQRSYNPPKVARSSQCPDPARTRSVERHLSLGEPLCVGCAEFDAVQTRAAHLDQQVMTLAGEGQPPSMIGRQLGLPRDTVAAVVRKYRKRQLRQEVAA